MLPDLRAAFRITLETGSPQADHPPAARRDAGILRPARGDAAADTRLGARARPVEHVPAAGAGGFHA
jgi:hypothetical protein